MSTSRLGNYVIVDWDCERGDIAPLVEALSYAIQANRRVDFFLEGIFTGNGPSGGDPGWAIDRATDQIVERQFHVYMSSDISGHDIDEAVYDEATVKRHVRRTLENFAAMHPDRKQEVEEALLKYKL
jgi:hypothetical protein